MTHTKPNLIYRGYNKFALYNFMFERVVLQNCYSLDTYKERKRKMLEIYLELLGIKPRNEVKKMS